MSQVRNPFEPSGSDSGMPAERPYRDGPVTLVSRTTGFAGRPGCRPTVREAGSRDDEHPEAHPADCYRGTTVARQAKLRLKIEKRISGGARTLVNADLHRLLLRAFRSLSAASSGPSLRGEDLAGSPFHCRDCSLATITRLPLHVGQLQLLSIEHRLNWSPAVRAPLFGTVARQEHSALAIDIPVLARVTEVLIIGYEPGGVNK